MLNSGLRISELCALSIKDIKLTDRKGRLIVRQGKGGKHREVPLNSLARDSLKAWMKVHAKCDRAMIVLLLNSGLRISELCALSTKDIELTDRKGKLIVRQDKGSKKREVPLNRIAREALKDWMNVRTAGDALFEGKRGDRLSPSGVYRRLVELARRAKLEDVSPHTLRHTFSKNLVDAGVGLEHVAALLGQSNLNYHSHLQHCRQAGR